MEERIGDSKDRNLEMVQMEEVRELRVKKVKEFFKNYLTPSKEAT